MFPSAFLLLVILLLLLLLLLLWRVRTLKTNTPPPPTPPDSGPGPGPGPSPGPPSAPGIPSQFNPSSLAKTLSVRMVGTPADGSRAAASASQPSGPVIWVDHGDEVLVHLESMQIEMQEGLILVSVDLETDQTSRTPLIVSIAVGKTDDGAGLIGVTDEYPRGNGILAARWGTVLQDAVWNSLLGLAKDFAMQTGQAPRAVSVTSGALALHAGTPLTATASKAS
jgi:hypothetical protein